MTDHDSVTKLTRWSAVVIGVAAFVLYLFTAGPSVVELFDDSLEFQLVGPTFGIAHPTGYPLYVLLGALWSRLLLPVGNWAWRMNVFSALTGGMAIALLFALTCRLVPRVDGRPNLWAGAAAALAFGLGPLWWSQATIAEVYSLHILLATAILSVTIGMNETLREPADGRHRLNRRMTWLSLLLGLGLAHHRTTVLLVPALVLYLVWSVPDLWRPRWVWFRWFGVLLLPLLLYLLIPMRAAMGMLDLNASYVNSWVGFWRHILASGYVAFFAENDLGVARTVADWFALLRGEMGGVGLLLALLGLSWLVDRQRRPAKAWLFLLIVLLSNLLFALNYRVGDAELFLLPVFLTGAIFVGGGVGLFDRLLQRWPPWGQVIQALLVVALALTVWPGLATVNRSQDWAVHDYAVAMATVDFPADSHVIGLEGEITALKYMQQAEGLGRAATAVVADLPDVRRQEVANLLAAGMPVYLTRELSGIEDLYSFSGEGPLIRVWPRGASPDTGAATLLGTELLEGALTIEGLDLILLEQAGGPALQVVYHWLPNHHLDRNLKLSIRVNGSDGSPLLWPNGDQTVVDNFPLRQAALTSDWLPGESVTDVHTIGLPPAMLMQAATLETILYDAETIEEVGRFSVDLAATLGNR